MSTFDFTQNERMEREHAAWLDVGLEFQERGIDINEGGFNTLIYAIRKWGEELVQLRVGDSNPSHAINALREARENYEGQFERGEYPTGPSDA